MSGYFILSDNCPIDRASHYLSQTSGMDTPLLHLEIRSVCPRYFEDISQNSEWNGLECSQLSAPAALRSVSNSGSFSVSFCSLEPLVPE